MVKALGDVPGGATDERTDNLLGDVADIILDGVTGVVQGDG